MKRITDVIVKGRYFFLSLFIVLAIVSLFLIPKVNINEDIMKYLPETSETKIGKDIMEESFDELDSSNLNVMFKGLSDEEKKETLHKLESIEGVSSVDYEDTEAYNKDGYTLYKINVDDYANSERSKNVFKYVDEHFDTAGMDGTIYEENKPLLQLWIVILAIACAMVILIILSDSFVEPWLYLISIGIAVFINKGTNIMFESVSSITDSIVAILQLALSMDYSIMLSNRFKQEKEKNPNKVEAMKEALYHSFKSISSSSVTTVVGLLALVFMSFTIGRDLGFVLAKGVILSLLSIFLCLPGLLLIFDNLIGKTKKKAPNFNLEKLGKFIYKTRHIQAVLILVLFLGTFIIKGNVNVLYTGSEQDKVGKVFPATNQIAIVYNNKHEARMAELIKRFEQDEKIEKILGYSNTLNEKLAYNELNAKFEDLGESTSIDDYLIKIIYYNYYNRDNKNKMTLNQFINFIETDIYSNDKFSDKVNDSTRNNLKQLKNFTDKQKMNAKRTISEIADLLNINEEDAAKILIFYNSKNLNTEMTISEFVNFMLNDVANDQEYSSNLDSATIAKLKKLSNFANKNNINKKMNSSELSSMFGIDEALVDKLLMFYRTNNSSDTKMTLNQFATFALQMADADEFKDMFTAETKASLTMLSTLSNSSVIEKDLNQKDMKTSLSQLGINLDDNSLALLYIYYTGQNTDTKLTLNGFAEVALNMASQDNYKKYFSDETKASLQKIKSLNAYYSTTMPNSNLYAMFGIDEATGAKLNYAITGNPAGTFAMTPLQFVQTLLQTDAIKAALSETQIASLTTAQYIMSNTTTSYSVSELSKALSQDKTVSSVVYGVYDYQNGKLKDVSIKNLVNFLYSNKSNPMISASLASSSDMLNLAHTIVNNTTTKFTYKEISKITGTNEAQVNKIFGVYDYNTQETKLTPMELADLILNNKDNELLKGKVSESSLKDLTLVTEVMTSTINNKKYSSKGLSSLLGIDNSKMSLLFSLYNSKYIKAGSEISLYDFVNFIKNEVMDSADYGSSFDNKKKEKINTVKKLMDDSINGVKYTYNEAFGTLTVLSDNLDKSLIELVYLYYGSTNEYDESWKLTIEEFINYLNSDIITDSRFDEFIDNEKRETVTDAKKTIDKSKKMLVSEKYSRLVLNTKYPFEEKETFDFIEKLKQEIGDAEDIYVVGNSPMAVEMSKTFNDELNKITLLTMIFIFVVVAVTFKDLIIPVILVLIIQTAVYTTMSFISLTGGSVYFISVLIVQAILMGATIDYAIVYTAYYREMRLTKGIRDSIINAYNKSIHTIISSGSILIIVTLIVARFAGAIAAKICETVSQGTLTSVILVLLVLPGVLATMDKLICRKGYFKEDKKKHEK